MSQSLSKVYLHITFSTKNSQPFIDNSIEDSLFEYIGGTYKGLDGNPLKVDGHLAIALTGLLVISGIL